MSRSIRSAALAALIASAATLAMVLSVAPAAQAKGYTPPPIKHVWVINLENESYGYTFGAAGHKFAPYLTKTLVSQGAFLRD